MSKTWQKQGNIDVIARDPARGILLAAGPTVPSDATVGYAPNCLFLDTDATGGVGFYCNRGTRASANFDVAPDLWAISATAAEINAYTDSASRRVAVTDATTYTVLAANSGKVHVIPDLTSSCTLTLPTAADGLEYEFIGKGVAADGQNWVFDTGAAANYYLGGLSFLDNDAGAGADEVHAGVYPNGSSNDIMTIVTPAAGTRIYMICDGTNWIVNGIVVSATIPTFADT